MGKIMVRYKVKPDQAALNEELVRNVYEELKQTSPAGIRYATFLLQDCLSFVNIASNDSEDGQNPLMKVAAFRAFQEGARERCQEGPVASDLREVGSYGFWADSDTFVKQPKRPNTSEMTK